MKTTKRWFLFLVIGLMGIAGCADPLLYQTVTDGMDSKEYLVVGRVTDSGNRPVENCSVYLFKQNGGMQPIPVGVTDGSGNYHFVFELEWATQFGLYFDARDQGYPLRYKDFSHLLESSLFQYTGNNPVIVNAVIDKRPTAEQPL